MIVASLLKRFLRSGTVTVIGPSGRRKTMSVTKSPHIVIRLTTHALTLKLLTVPNFFLAEGYVNGELQIQEGNLYQLLEILMGSYPDNVQPTFFDKVRNTLSPLTDYILRIGSKSKSIRHVQSHYDRADYEFFRNFLDRNMQYSCAYFKSGNESIDEAQLAKMRHITSKLRLFNEARVLDIGSGWGGLAEFISTKYGARVNGITLSREQLKISNALRSSKTVQFQEKDYRAEDGLYDRIVSVGMLEHVGRDNYAHFFLKLESLLQEDGLALIHTIGRRGMPSPINLWIRRRIFAGAYLPSLSQLTAAVERTGLWLLDCENLRLHYAETLRCWHTALEARKIDIEAEFGDKFYRTWEFYLIACELGFRYQGLTVYQLLVGKRPDSAPLTRNFMYDEERRLEDDKHLRMDRGRENTTESQGHGHREADDRAA